MFDLIYSVMVIMTKLTRQSVLEQRCREEFYPSIKAHCKFINWQCEWRLVCGTYSNRFIIQKVITEARLIRISVTINPGSVHLGFALSSISLNLFRRFTVEITIVKCFLEAIK